MFKTTHVKAIELVSCDESKNHLDPHSKVTVQALFHTLWNPTNLLGRLQGHRLAKSQILLVIGNTEIGTCATQDPTARLAHTTKAARLAAGCQQELHKKNSHEIRARQPNT